MFQSNSALIQFIKKNKLEISLDCSSALDMKYADDQTLDPRSFARYYERALQHGERERANPAIKVDERLKSQMKPKAIHYDQKFKMGQMRELLKGLRQQSMVKHEAQTKEIAGLKTQRKELIQINKVLGTAVKEHENQIKQLEMEKGKDQGMIKRLFQNNETLQGKCVSHKNEINQLKVEKEEILEKYEKETLFLREELNKRPSVEEIEAKAAVEKEQWLERRQKDKERMVMWKKKLKRRDDKILKLQRQIAKQKEEIKSANQSQWFKW